MVLVLGTVVFLTGRRQNVRELPLLGQAGYNLASCLKKNAPAPDVDIPLELNSELYSPRQVLFFAVSTTKKNIVILIAVFICPMRKPPWRTGRR